MFITLAQADRDVCTIGLCMLHILRDVMLCRLVYTVLTDVWKDHRACFYLVG